MLSCILSGQTKKASKQKINYCEEKAIELARQNGYRSLSSKQKLEYHLNLRKCNPVDVRKAIRKEVSNQQLKKDAKDSKSFVGKASTFSYCVMLLMVYLSLN